jgi:hypothetical protein
LLIASVDVWIGGCLDGFARTPGHALQTLGAAVCLLPIPFKPVFLIGIMLAATDTRVKR